ncbi:hypothetical protein ACFZBE_41425 [Streptomyces sp. NPDC008061]|uniref:hypothetical protein n=1 Tax=Streptomyces sp. NPDC008061 TaxID=3364805 RepID=UPI0036F0233E
MSIALYVEQFLQCALDLSGGDLQEVLGTEQILSNAQLNEADEQAIISALLSRQLVTREFDQADGSSPFIRLTANGLEEANRLRTDSQSKAKREVYLHSVLVRWAHQNAPAGGWASLQLFARDEHWWFCGTQVTWDEVDAAVNYLAERGLLQVQRTIGHTSIAPTALGTDFAHSHATLRTFMTQQQGSGDTYHVTNNGGTNQIGSNNILNITNGFQPDQLAQFAQQVLAAAVTMDVPDSLREQITEDAQTLRREAEREEPQPGRIRRFLEGLQESLIQAGQDEVAKQLFQSGALFLAALAS